MTASDLDRSFDDALVLLAIEAWNKELAAADGLSQTFELTTLANEVRSHRQNDVDRRFLLCSGLKQQPDEFVRRFLLFLTGFVEPEDLFELVDHEKEIRPVIERRLFDRFNQAEVWMRSGLPVDKLMELAANSDSMKRFRGRLFSRIVTTAPDPVGLGRHLA